ncbi:hypothetical protein FACS1894151_01250 [Spirochaetia bacterium]|nr:hypothetical protein FACS1894151_01250 [Spirochaetia bacterium]
MKFLGLKKIENILLTTQGGKLVVIGAIPSLGKTSMALNLLKEITMEQSISSILFSLEMPKSAVEKRMTEIGFIGNDHFKIFDDSKITFEEILNVVDNEVKESMVKFCFIDYFNLLPGNHSEIVKNLKALAVKLNIIIIVLIQMKSIKPELSHYEIVSNDSDLIIALNKNNDQKETELLILKNIIS